MNLLSIVGLLSCLNFLKKKQKKGAFGLLMGFTMSLVMGMKYMCF